MNTLNTNYLSSAAFCVFLMHSVSGSLSINISFTYWDWMGALRHSVLFIIQIGHLILDPRSFPQHWELSFQHHKITAWSCIAVFFSFGFVCFWFGLFLVLFCFHWELFFQHHIAPRLFNGCLPLCTEDQFRLHFQLLLLPVGLSILLHLTQSTSKIVNVSISVEVISHWTIRNNDKF